jgi:hypothetical protein
MALLTVSAKAAKVLLAQTPRSTVAPEPSVVAPQVVVAADLG